MAIALKDTFAHWSRDPRMVVIANFLSLGLSTIRNVALARLLGPEQFGVAATLLLLILIADGISETGADRFLVQSGRGDEGRVQDTVQGVTLVRGIFQGSIMIAAALPLSLLFNTPGAVTGYMWLAFYPLFIGLVHLDIKRLQRHGQYGPETLMTICGDVASLVVAVTAAVWLRDYRAALVGLIARAFLMMAISHVLAERRFRIKRDPEILQEVFRFGWPLFFTAIANFVGLQGDRSLVGALMGPHELGIYSAAAMLVTAPVNVMTMSFVRVGLARLAQLQSDLEAFDREYLLFTSLVFGCSALAVAGFAGLGQAVGHVLFGKAYQSPALLYALLGGVNALRLLRIWPTCGSFALGRTHDLMVASIARLSSIPFALLFFYLWPSLIALVCGLLVGETISVAAAILRYNRLRGHPQYHDARILLAFLIVIGLGCAIAYQGSASFVVAAGGFAALVILALVVTLIFKPSLVGAFRQLIASGLRYKLVIPAGTGNSAFD